MSESDQTNVSGLMDCFRLVYTSPMPLGVTYELKIIKIGKAAGIILPEKALVHLGVKVGDTLSAVVTPHGIDLAKR